MHFHENLFPIFFLSNQNLKRYLNFFYFRMIIPYNVFNLSLSNLILRIRFKLGCVYSLELEERGKWGKRLELKRLCWMVMVVFWGPYL